MVHKEYTMSYKRMVGNCLCKTKYRDQTVTITTAVALVSFTIKTLIFIVTSYIKNILVPIKQKW
uniref:Uncharacterized protein n=1 Tax=Octopus bimaculoides TaxID=37653 RepID=A0A0L8FVU7_OCTBM